MHRHSGFTLVELLVVIGILAVLAAVLLPSYLGAQKRSHDVASLSCGNAIRNAQVSYRMTHPVYATDPVALGSDVKEACADHNVQISPHGGPYGAALSSYAMSGTTATSYAFAVWEPQGTGYYKFWTGSPCPMTCGDRLNILVPWP